MNITAKFALVTVLCLSSVKAYASREVWDAMELLNAVSDDGESLAVKGLTGKGVGVAILDMTINRAHPVLKDAEIINCGSLEDQIKYKGLHGQYAATPIVGITYPQKLMLEGMYDKTTEKRYNVAYWRGLAPETTVYSYPYVTSCFFPEDNRKIIGVLEQILSKNLDIARNGEGVPVKLMNMSFELTREFYETDVVRQFKQVEEAGILVIHAAGNHNAAGTVLPGSLQASDNWIEVGALSSWKYKTSKYFGWSGGSYNSGSNYPRADSAESFIWAPGHIIPVAGREAGPCLQSGTSFAGPYVVAGGALAWEENMQQTYREIKARLMSCPIYDITMSTEKKISGSTVSYESHKVQKPVLDIRHLLDS